MMPEWREGPLTGLRVIDLSSVVFGPVASQVLADYGAEVVKVEPPGGDSTRHTGPAVEPGMEGLDSTGSPLDNPHAGSCARDAGYPRVLARSRKPYETLDGHLPDSGHPELVEGRWQTEEASTALPPSPCLKRNVATIASRPRPSRYQVRSR